jgi:chemotaxis protein methyltransferase CheR
MAQFDRIRAYVHQVSGITLDPSKDYLINARFDPLVRELGCKDIDDIVACAQADRTGKVREQVVDAITTNETFFFREPQTFKLFEFKLLPDAIDRSGSGIGGVRIWCAACSTGQEPYTIAMVMEELFYGDPPCPIQIYATDICDEAVAKASSGLYTQFELNRGLDAQRIAKYFDKEGTQYRIKDHIRSQVRFSKGNLFNPGSAPARGFDIVFLRNVMIYFNADDKRVLYSNIASLLKPGGNLVVGSSELVEPYTDCYTKNNKHFSATYYEKG